MLGAGPPSPIYVKPQTPSVRIDWTNPDCIGLVDGWACTDSNRSTFYVSNITGHARGTVTKPASAGQHWPIEGWQEGSWFDFGLNPLNSGTNAVAYVTADPTNALYGGSIFTCEARFWYGDVQALNGFTYMYSSNIVRIGFKGNGIDGGFPFVVGAPTGGAVSSISNIAMNSARGFGLFQQTVHYTWDGTKGHIYWGGSPTEDTYSSQGTSSGTFPWVTSNTFLGKEHTTSTNGWRGWLGHVLVWNRLLSPQERMRRVQNPYGIFLPELMRRTFFLGVAIAATANAPLQSVNISQFAPTETGAGQAAPPLQTVSISQFAPTESGAGAAAPPLQTVNISQPAAEASTAVVPPTQTVAISQFAPTASGAAPHHHPRARPPVQRVLISQFAVTVTAPRTFPQVQVVALSQFTPTVTGQQIAKPPLQTVLINQPGIGGVTVVTPQDLLFVRISQFTPTVTGTATMIAPLQTVQIAQFGPVAAAPGGANAVATPPVQTVSISQFPPRPVQPIIWFSPLPLIKLGVPIIREAQHVTWAGVGPLVTVGPDWQLSQGTNPKIVWTSVGPLVKPGDWQLAVKIVWDGFKFDGLDAASRSLPWAANFKVGVWQIHEATQIITWGGVGPLLRTGTPRLLDTGQQTNPTGPTLPLVPAIISAGDAGGPVNTYFDDLRNSVDPDAFDILWTQRLSDGTDTFEYKVPASHISGMDVDDNPIVVIDHAELADGTILTNPLTGIPYKLFDTEEEYREDGSTVLHFTFGAPHYDLGWIAAIPFRTAPATDASGNSIDEGASLQEILDCLNSAGSGWLFTGTACAAFAVDARCPFQANPPFDSTQASILTQLYQVSQVWGGSWFFDELNHIATLSCNTGADSGVVAHWRKNLKSLSKKRTMKPRQQVLVVEQENGVMTGKTAQMMLAELEAENNCDDYLAQQALQSAQDSLNQQNGQIPNDYDPCVGLAAMDGIPTSLTGGAATSVTIVQSDALKSYRKYLYESWLLEQMPQVSYQAAVLDLSMLPEANESDYVTLGSWLTVIQDELGIADGVRCVARTYNLLEPWKSQLELSNEVPWLSIVLPTAALRKDSTKLKNNTTKKPPLGPDTGFCWDNSAIEADWIPPPKCIGQGEKLKMAYQDKLTQLQNLKDNATAIQTKAQDAIAELMAIEEGARAAGVFLNLDSFIQNLIDLLGKIQEALLNAEVQVLQAQQALDQATIITDNEADAQQGMKECPQIDLGGTLEQLGSWSDFWKMLSWSGFLISQASAELDKGHWEWQVTSFKYGDCNGDPLPSAPTPLGKGSGLDNATKSMADGACYYAKITLPQVQQQLQGNGKTSTHVNCGDITTTTTVIGSGGGFDPTPSLYQVFHIARDIIDAGVILNKQWEKVTQTDKLAEELRNNVKECSKQTRKNLLLALAMCQQAPLSANEPGPGGAPFGNATNPGGGAAGIGVTADGQSTGGSVGGSGGIDSVASPPRGGDLPGTNCLNHLAGIARSIVNLADGIDGWITAGQDAVTKIDQARQLAGALVAQTPPPPDMPAVAPDWNIDVTDVNLGINGIRDESASMGASALDMLQAVQALDPSSLDQMAAALSKRVNPNDPANAELIKAGADARDNLEAARNLLNTSVCDTIENNSALQNYLVQFDHNQQATQDAIWAYGQTIGSYTMDEDIQGQAVAALTMTPLLVKNLEDAANALASYATALNQQLQALLDAVDCADSYVQLAGVDLNHQRSTSVQAQNSLRVISPEVQGNPDAYPFGVPAIDDDGHFLPTLFIQHDDPADSYPDVPDGTLWAETPAP